MSERSGYWVVLVTHQMGLCPDDVLGPFWDQETAEDMAAEHRSAAAQVGRRDRYTVGYVVIPEEQA
jgi:hypothetical protein